MVTPRKVVDPAGYRVASPHLALTRTSLQWPKHWQKVIYKITRMHKPSTYELVYVVIPKNPEYVKYLDEETLLKSTHVGEAPCPYLDTIEFDTIDEVEHWAAVCSRLDN